MFLLLTAFRVVLPCREKFSMSKAAKKKTEERVYFDIKYGPLTIHQNGVIVKELAVTPLSSSNGNGSTHRLENMRLSLHLERFQAIEPFLEEVKCTISFPELGYALSQDAPCLMKVGYTHGSSVVSAQPIMLSLENSRDTVMEVEYFLGESSLTKLTIPVKVPEQN